MRKCQSAERQRRERERRVDGQTDSSRWLDSDLPKEEDSSVSINIAIVHSSLSFVCSLSFPQIRSTLTKVPPSSSSEHQHRVSNPPPLIVKEGYASEAELCVFLLNVSVESAVENSHSTVHAYRISLSAQPTLEPHRTAVIELLHDVPFHATRINEIIQ